MYKSFYVMSFFKLFQIKLCISLINTTTFKQTLLHTEKLIVVLIQTCLETFLSKLINHMMNLISQFVTC